MSGEDRVEELRAALREGRLGAVTGPFEGLVGFRAVHDPDHGVRVELEVGERRLNQYGVAHGGVALTLLDAAGGIACFLGVPRLARVATISLSTNFLRAVGPGRVAALAGLDQVGGAVAYASVRLHEGGPGGPPLATATGAYRLFRERGG